MNEALAQWHQLPDSARALIWFVAGLALFVVAARWAISKFRVVRQRWRAANEPNVVPMRRPRAPTLPLPQRKQGSRGKPNPLWLVALAIILAILFRSGIWSELTPNETLSGVVTHVRDGDTIEVNRRPIRLNGLTCDERGTPLGNQATAAMRELVAGKTVTCALNGDRTYDREVGRCSLADGGDIGANMISQGLCGRCARYDPLRDYAAVQRKAGPFRGAHPAYCWALW